MRHILVAHSAITECYPDLAAPKTETMFETVVPEAASPRSRRLLYETLPLSLAVHALLAAAVVVGASWNIEFPPYSPNLYALYSLTATPPPPPPPQQAVKRTTSPQVKAAPVKMPFVAPPFIPDTIPVVEDTVYEEIAAEPVGPVAANGVEGGIEGGEIGGQLGGIVGGLLTAPAPEVIEVKRDEPLPIGAISQEYPVYPEFARSRGWQDELVVRYVIGKDGRVKEVTVIRAPEREEFARETLSAIRHWRFHPYRNEQGEPKEVVHELTVQFKIAHRRSAGG